MHIYIIHAYIYSYICIYNPIASTALPCSSGDAALCPVSAQDRKRRRDGRLVLHTGTAL